MKIDPRRNRRVAAPFAALLLLAAAGCSLAPRYVRPDVAAPASFKEAPAATAPGSPAWKAAEPAESAPRGAWWSVYGDPDLDALEAQVDVSSQTVLAAAAQFRQARALAASARSSLFPTVGIAPSATRRYGTTSASSSAPATTTDTLALPIAASWEADAWGALRNGADAGAATAQAAAAQAAAVLLQVQAEVALDYFELRALDEQLAVLRETVERYGEALQLTKDRLEGGVAAQEDVAQATTVLEAAKAQELDAGVARAQLEHALAVLVGKAPAEFSLAPAKRTVAVPAIPLVLPSELLERRPDVGAAERRVAAANAQIGVARAAYFPAIALSGQAGTQSGAAAGLLSLPNRVWSLGVSAATTLFDGGRRRAGVEEARASYDLAVANYRQTVLGAFQEVEDDLVGVRMLGDEALAQERALAAARETLDLSNVRYVGGVVSYLDVVSAETSALTRELSLITTRSRRLQASVQLVKALGGGWDASRIPAPR